MSNCSSCDIWQTVFSGFTTLGVIIVVVQYLLTKKQLHQATIARCIDAFRDFGNVDSETSESGALKKYIDLVNEELFYIQHQYIPKDIAIEWIDGMLDMIPLYSVNGDLLKLKFTNQNFIKQKDYYFVNFPRIKNTFIIENAVFNQAQVLFTGAEESQDEIIMYRKRICSQIYENVKGYKF